MRDEQKTKKQLIDELVKLRQLVAETKGLEAERKMTEEALKEAEEKYRLLVDLSPDPVVVLQGDRYQFVSPAFTEAFGYSQQDVADGLSFYELVQEHDKKAVRRQYRNRLAGKQVPKTFRIDLVAKDGKEIPCETSAALIHYKGKPADLVLIRDITERKQAEEALQRAHDELEQKVEERTNELLKANRQLKREIKTRKRAEKRLKESETYLRGILKAAPIGIGLVHDRVVEWTNDRMREMLGYSEDELVGKSARIAYESEEEFERVGTVKYSQIQASGMGTVETRFRSKDGSALDVLLSSSALDYEDLSKGVVFTALDISERKLAEEALRESEERFRHLSEAAFEAIVIHEEGVILQANDQYYEMFGYEPEELEGIDAIPLTATAESAAFMKEQIVSDNLGPYEVVGLRKDGTTFPMEIRIKIMENQASKVRMAAIRDLTERKQAEQQLRESELRYSSLFKNNHSVMLLIDPVNADIVDANPAACSFYGWTREELTSMRITDINMLSDEQVFQEIERAKSEERSHFFFRHRLANGEIRDVEVYSGPIRVHGKELLYSIIHDISERKRAEEALRESEHYFRSLLFNMHEDIQVIDRDYRITDVNNTLLVTTGLRYEEVIGRHCYEISHGYNEPCERKGEDCMLREVFETGEPGNCRHQHIRADGSKAWVDILLSPLRDENGKVTHVIEAIRDVTDLVEMEEVLRESEANFRALADNANDGILIAAGEGIHVYANKRAAKITGYSVAELLEIGLYELVAPDEVKKIARRLKRRLAGEKVPGQYETSLVRKSGKIFPAELSSARSIWKTEPASIVIIRDITKRKQREADLRNSSAELLEKTRHLEEVNSALKVLLERREEDKEELGEKVVSNVKQLLSPYLGKLRKSHLEPHQATLVEILESNIKEIVSPFITKLSSKFLNLTPTEIQVASLIKDGRTNKDIAALLNLSVNTVRSHRHHIRTKLGLKSTRMNLRSYLHSLQYE